MILYAERTKEFEKTLEKIKYKDKILFDRIEKKIKEILLNPEHYKPLRNVLKGLRRIQFGSYVLKYEIKEDLISFIEITDHDHAY